MLWGVTHLLHREELVWGAEHQSLILQGRCVVNLNCICCARGLYGGFVIMCELGKGVGMRGDGNAVKLKLCGVIKMVPLGILA